MKIYRTSDEINASRLDKDWIANCRSNEGDETLEDWLRSAGNYTHVEIDETGAVWAEGAGGAGWLGADRLEELALAIEAGV